MGYNGWKNYPTWNVALWLDNEEGTYLDVQRMAREARGRADLADDLRDYVEMLGENQNAPTSGFVADLYGWALESVDWFELADHYLDGDESCVMRYESGAIRIETVGVLLLLAGFAYLAAHIVAFALRAMDTVGGAI